MLSKTKGSVAVKGPDQPGDALRMKGNHVGRALGEGHSRQRAQQVPRPGGRHNFRLLKGEAGGGVVEAEEEEEGDDPEDGGGRSRKWGISRKQ